MLLLSLGFNLYAQSFELKSGDILLQPLKCWGCTLIEEQENSKFSHIGIVIEMDNKLWVAEALSQVRLVELANFQSRTQSDKKILVRRLRSLPSSPAQFTVDLVQRYYQFHGNPYDRKFRWNNFINKREAIYCSELLYKMLKGLVAFTDLAPKPMTFDVNPELWDRYFNGNTPRGELGISPEDFALSYDFFDVGEL